MKRVAMYSVIHTATLKCKFLPKVVKNLFDHLTNEIASGGLKLEKSIQ